MLTDSIPYFATCAKGLEPVLEQELGQECIGAQQIKIGASGVYFTGDPGVGYRACLWSRCGVRVLSELARARVSTPDDLYQWACTIRWQKRMKLSQTFSVEARVWDSDITHSKYAALRIKDALCDAFRKQTGERPNVNVAEADLPLFLYIYRNEAILYRDLSGTTLHKRGYRGPLHKSSLNEAVAAGIILLSQWDRCSPLVDPMCGSGTFAIEAALIALNRAPGLQRKRFPFESWPDFEPDIWKTCKAQAQAGALESLPFMIGANDHHAGALSLAKRDAQAAGVSNCITFSNADITEYQPKQTPTMVITNPPWGQRLQPDDLARPWKGLGDFLKSHCDGASAMILSGSKEATRHLRLKASKKFPLRHGKLDCRVLRYEIQGRREPLKKKE